MNIELNPDECNNLVYKYGQQVGVAESREQADKICKTNNAKPNNGLWDWNTAMGRCMVKHLPQEKLDAINILNDLINGSDDELADKMRIVQKGLLPERTIG